MATYLEQLEESMNGFEARVQELLDAMNERGPEYVHPWMKFSGEMVEKLESSTMEEYDEWRVSTGCIPLFRSTIRKGKEALLEKLKIQQKIDNEAFARYLRG